MLAQRIRKVSKVHQSIVKTTPFLIYWLTEIQSDSLLYGRENEEIPNQHVLLWLKDCLTLKNALENSLNCAHYNKRHK